MELTNRLAADLIAAMKEKNKDKLTILRMIKGAMQLENINTKRELNDELATEVVLKQIKMRNESIKEFEKGLRTDLIEQTQKEIDILMTYLPKQLSENEIVEIIDKIFIEMKPQGHQDMGKIMKEVTSHVKGKADMSLVSSIIKQKLN